MTTSFVDGLKNQIGEIEHFKATERFSPQFKSWKTKTRRLLERTFGQDSSHLQDFMNIHFIIKKIVGIEIRQIQKRYIFFEKLIS